MINQLTIGASKNVVFSYIIKETDIGKTNLTQTITVSSDKTIAQSNSPIINVEPLRKTMSISVVRTNNPTNGSEYAKNETVTFNIIVTNTGNQTLSNIVVSGVTNGATINNSTITNLGIGATSTVTGSYIIQQSDLGKTNLTISFKATSGTVTVQSTSPVLPVKKAVPTTESEFKAASWAEVKTWADSCAASGSADYAHMLGWSRPITITGYGTTNAVLKAFNNKTKTAGGKAGFVFECENIVLNWYTGTLDTTFLTWEKSLIRSKIQSDVISNMPSDLTAVIAEVNNECCTSASTGTNSPSVTNTADRVWIPSWIEICGTNSGNVGEAFDISNPPKEGTQFDWYAKNIGALNRVKKLIGTDSSSNWWVRTPCTVNNTYGFYLIYSNRGTFVHGRNYALQSYGIVPCFAI